MTNKELLVRLEGLVVFRSVLSDEVIDALKCAMETFERNAGLIEEIGCLARFEATLFDRGTDWSAYLLTVVLDSDNPYARAHAKAASGGGAIDRRIESCAQSELAFFSKLASLTIDYFVNQVPEDLKIDFWNLPTWGTAEIDFAAEYARHLEEKAALPA